ncbi:MAG: tetratricopeptide (TPR) repeat protein [Lentisphaeria bacterium]|jgi:tetratricopeptide (TPR) repeat protein
MTYSSKLYSKGACPNGFDLKRAASQVHMRAVAKAPHVCLLITGALFKLRLALIVLLFSACASSPKPPAEAPSSVESVDALFVMIPSPYQGGEVAPSARKEFAQIKALMAAKKWDDAKGALELMVATYPQLAGPYTNLGIVEQRLGNPEQAKSAFKYAIETNPNNLDAYTQLGVLYRELGRFSEAEAVYLQALQVWPHHLQSTTNIGVLYDLYMGRFEEALSYYELSQKIAGGEDRQLKGWIFDLRRRMGGR